MVKIKPLGGIYEVGRSSFFIGGETAGVLLDCGVAVNHETRYPVYVNPKLFDQIILSHCHLDHIGATPIFFMGSPKKVVGSTLTKELGEILELDFIKVSRGYLPFEVLEVKRMFDFYTERENRKALQVGRGIEATLMNAGHVPGGCQVFLTVDGKNVLYTGDVNLRSTRLVPGADTQYPSDVDVAIVEATYASVDHPPRDEVEGNFVDTCKEVVESGGTVLVPAFGVGRSQEILCVLKQHNFPHDARIDGMAKKVSEVLSQHAKSLQDPELFLRAINWAEWLSSDDERRSAADSPGVIVTPAGMLKGGPASFYSKRVAKERKNAILLVSYQVEGTPGHVLQQKRVLTVGGEQVKVKAKVQSFDFSSHCGKGEYVELLRAANPKSVIIAHGSKDNCDYLANQCKNLGIRGILPQLGAEYAV